MHGIETINFLEQRRADNAEAERILREHGHDIKVIGAELVVESQPAPLGTLLAGE